jgi:hypothetical protein
MTKPLPYYCDDWDCPARVSCKHAFVRQKEYAEMKDGGYRLSSVEADGFYDRRLRNDCDRYELDKPKPHLATWFGMDLINKRAN